MKNFKKKRFNIYFLCVLCVFMFASCSKEGEPDLDVVIPIQTENKADEAKASDYILQKENSLYKYVNYDENTNSVVSLDRYEMTLFANEDLYQIKSVFNDFSETDKIIEVTDDYAKVLGETVINTRENILDNNNIFIENSAYNILNMPIEIGSSWQYNEIAVSEVVDMNVSVELPFSSVNAIIIQTNFEDGVFRKDYYSKGIGLVKTVISDAQNGDKVIVLESISEMPITVMDDVFLYDAQKDDKTSIQVESEINYGVDYTSLLESLLKYSSNPEFMPPLIGETKIQSISIDRDIDLVVIDFTDNFFEKINAGSSIEAIIVSNIVDTVGNFYNVSNVKILIKGSPMTDGHITLDEVFAVNKK